VRSSHERWDGTGYPDGLSGEAIPLEARIVSACDAFNAMTTTRPYRAAMPAEDARAELERNAGSQFDPAVVSALLRVTAA
jgi:HD-GYP domain-containing protein (c-di-GMP phosphodiesterase class II)